MLGEEQGFGRLPGCRRPTRGRHQHQHQQRRIGWLAGTPYFSLASLPPLLLLSPALPLLLLPPALPLPLSETRQCAGTCLGQPAQAAQSNLTNNKKSSAVGGLLDALVGSQLRLQRQSHRHCVARAVDPSASEQARCPAALTRWTWCRGTTPTRGSAHAGLGALVYDAAGDGAAQDGGCLQGTTSRCWATWCCWRSRLGPARVRPGASRRGSRLAARAASQRACMVPALARRCLPTQPAGGCALI